MEPESLPIHESIFVGDEARKIENNVAAFREISEGNIEQGFMEAEVIVQEEFKTGRIYHAQMETKSVVCVPEADGGITVWTTTQTIHNVRQLLGEIFCLPLSKVNVKRISVGGSFGSSIQMNSVVPIGVALALKARRPVKLVSTREEDMYDHVKYPSQIKLRLGAKKDGQLIAGQMNVIVDIGAHNTQAYPLLGCMAGWGFSLSTSESEIRGQGGLYEQSSSLRHAGFWKPSGHLCSGISHGCSSREIGDGLHRAAIEELRRIGTDVLGARPYSSFCHS
jgi:xanthine dehydrogenase molybdenum-binding subunit